MSTYIYPAVQVTAGVASVNGIDGAVTLVAGSGISITPAGQNITIASTAVAGANTTLSNLGTTAINAALTFATGVAGVVHTTNTDLTLTGKGTATLQNNNTDSSAIYVFDGEIDIRAGAVGGGYINVATAGIGFQNQNGTGPNAEIYLIDSVNSLYVGLKAPTTLVASLDFVLPDTYGTSGQVLSTDGSGALSWVSAGGGATTALDNLASVAINTSLVFGSGTAGVLQTVNGGGDGISSQAVTIQSGDVIGLGSNSGNLSLLTGQVTSTGTSGNVLIKSGDSTSAAGGGPYTTGTTTISTGSNTHGANTNTGALTLSTGDSANGNSGDVVLQPGTASGTRGSITFVDGSEGTAGMFWSSKDTSGKGAWSSLFAVKDFGELGNNLPAVSTTTNSATGGPSLVFGSDDTANPAIVTNDVAILTGTQSDNTATGRVGKIYISPGYNYGTGVGAETIIQAGDVDQNGTPGDLFLFSGTGWNSNVSGNVIIGAGQLGITAAMGIIDLRGPAKFLNMTTTQRDALTAVEGEVIYNATTHKLQCYDGTIWQDLF